MKNSATKFITGAVIGLAAGIAANTFLKSKTGKRLKGEIKDIATDFYNYISPRVSEIKKMGKEEYQEFIKKAVQEYGKAKKISQEMVQDLMEQVKGSWKQFSHYLGK